MGKNEMYQSYKEEKDKNYGLNKNKLMIIAEVGESW